MTKIRFCDVGIFFACLCPLTAAEYELTPTRVERGGSYTLKVTVAACNATNKLPTDAYLETVTSGLEITEALVADASQCELTAKLVVRDRATFGKTIVSLLTGKDATKKLSDYPEEWARFSDSFIQTVNVLPRVSDFDVTIEHPRMLGLLRQLLGDELTFEEFSMMIRNPAGQTSELKGWHRGISRVAMSGGWRFKRSRWFTTSPMLSPPTTASASCLAHMDG